MGCRLFALLVAGVIGFPASALGLFRYSETALGFAPWSACSTAETLSPRGAKPEPSTTDDVTRLPVLKSCEVAYAPLLLVISVFVKGRVTEPCFD